MEIPEFLKTIARKILSYEIDDYQAQLLDLQNKVDEYVSEEVDDALEEELNNKYDKVDLTYSRTETDGTYKVDLRNFFMTEDANIPTVEGDTDDEKALAALKYVIDKITYTSDTSSKTYKQNEYWAYPYQTLDHKRGDCEDGAILLANIMVRSGIPYWKVRITAGDVDDGQGNSGGHAFVVYYYEEGGYWVLLDWCYWENTLEISERPNYKDESYYKDIWFSFNEKYCFEKDAKSTSVRRNLGKMKVKLKTKCGGK